MKLNMDCIRDVLLKLEEETEFKSDFSYRSILAEDFCGKFEKYSPHEVYHTLLKLEEAGYIYTLNGNPKNINWSHNPKGLIVLDITFSGSEFLNTIRDPKAWRFVKEKTSAFISVPFSIMTAVAAAYIKAQMGL